MTMITPSYLGETIEYSSLHACRSTLEDPMPPVGGHYGNLSLAWGLMAGGTDGCTPPQISPGFLSGSTGWWSRRVTCAHAPRSYARKEA